MRSIVFDLEGRNVGAWFGTPPQINAKVSLESKISTITGRYQVLDVNEIFSESAAYESVRAQTVGALHQLRPGRVHVSIAPIGGRRIQDPPGDRRTIVFRHEGRLAGEYLGDPPQIGAKVTLESALAGRANRCQVVDVEHIFVDDVEEVGASVTALHRWKPVRVEVAVETLPGHG